MRINAWLARGLERSRRECDELIRSGQVTINGNPASFNHKVAHTDEIRVRGIAINAPEKTYLLFNKPKGVLTAVRDNWEKTVMEFLPPKYRGLFPVGRLDRDTRGLLILTNDGHFSERVLHPRFGVLRVYQVELDRVPTMAALKRSVKLTDGPSRFAIARIVSAQPPIIEVGIREGRKRQIRLTLRAMGYRVVDLARTRVGDVQLGSIPEGKWREMTRSEIEGLTEGSRRAPRAEKKAKRGRKWEKKKKKRS